MGVDLLQFDDTSGRALRCANSELHGSAPTLPGFTRAARPNTRLTVPGSRPEKLRTPKAPGRFTLLSRGAGLHCASVFRAIPDPRERKHRITGHAVDL